MSELLPCPFCTPTIIPYVSQGRVSREGYSGPIWRVLCPQCGASSNSHDVESDAIAAWNLRASAPPADVVGLVERLREHAVELEYIDTGEWDLAATDAGKAADALVALAAERDRLREALRWYANDDEVEKFQIVDSKGEVIANFSQFTSRARAALGGSDAK